MAVIVYPQMLSLIKSQTEVLILFEFCLEFCLALALESMIEINPEKWRNRVSINLNLNGNIFL